MKPQAGGRWVWIPDWLMAASVLALLGLDRPERCPVTALCHRKRKGKKRKTRRDEDE